MNKARITQREIAKITNVSQATVSMVLSGKDYPNVRIPDATRERVLRAAEQMTYVADPAARRLSGLDNKILGIFTYELALSAESMDFYGPLLNGIERAAERISCDLLFFTSSPVVDGSRTLFDKRTRFRLADGCLLLGREMNGKELARLVDEGFPFVAVGRRDEPDVPYVGLDYPTLTSNLVAQFVAHGHQRLAYFHDGALAPAAVDRRSGIAMAATSYRVAIASFNVSGMSPADIASKVRDLDVTGVIVDSSFLAEAVAAELEPTQDTRPLSFAALSDVMGHSIGSARLAGFDMRREAMASRALSLLQELVIATPEERRAMQTQVLLQGSIIEGETIRSVQL